MKPPRAHLEVRVETIDGVDRAARGERGGHLVHDATREQAPSEGLAHREWLVAQRPRVDDGGVRDRLDRPVGVGLGGGEQRKRQDGADERRRTLHGLPSFRARVHSR